MYAEFVQKKCIMCKSVYLHSMHCGKWRLNRSIAVIPQNVQMVNNAFYRLNTALFVPLTYTGHHIIVYTTALGGGSTFLGWFGVD